MRFEFLLVCCLEEFHSELSQFGNFFLAHKQGSRIDVVREVGIRHCGRQHRRLCLQLDSFNVEKIVELLQRAEQEKVQVVCFPELSVTAYTCADLFFQEKLLLDAEKYLAELQLASFATTAVAIVGMPVRLQN